MYQTRNVNICQKIVSGIFPIQFILELEKKNIEFYQSMERLRKIKKKKKQSYYIHHGSFIDHDMKYIFNPFSIKHTQTKIIIYTKLF